MINFNIQFNPIKKTDLLALESLIGVKLPEDYKAHLLKFNGGSVPFDKEYTYNENIDFIRFHHLKEEGSNIEKYFRHKHDFLYPELLSIGTIVGGYIAMRIKGDDYGAIYVYYSDGILEKIADSFTDFINGLVVSDADF